MSIKDSVSKLNMTPEIESFGIGLRKSKGFHTETYPRHPMKIPRTVKELKLSV